MILYILAGIILAEIKVSAWVWVLWTVGLCSYLLSN